MFGFSPAHSFFTWFFVCVSTPTKHARSETEFIAIARIGGVTSSTVWCFANMVKIHNPGRKWPRGGAAAEKRPPRWVQASIVAMQPVT